MDNLFSVLKIQRFSLHDGPGVRTTVFLKGCPLNCVWCHNPESKSQKRQFFYTPTLCIGCGACVSECEAGAHSVVDGKKAFDRTKCTNCFECVGVCPTGAIEDCAKNLTADQIIDQALKDSAFYGEQGGITLSGGEPLLNGQKAVLLIEKAKRAGLNVVVQTCGQFDSAIIERIKDKVDLVLFDVKDTDEQRHIKNTGITNQKIMQNLLLLDKAGVKTVLRCIIVKTQNDLTEHYDKVITLYNSLKNCLGVEIFAHHTLGESKYISLGLEYAQQAHWSPSKEQLKSIKKYFNLNKVKCKIIE